NPSALFFNQIAATIQNRSTAPAGLSPTGGNSTGLRVPDGRSLLLVGGDINMDKGRLRAYGGRVELGGLGSPGTVGLQVDGNNLNLSFPENVARSSVSLTNGANIDVSAAGGGSIAVNARDVELSGGSVLIAGIGRGLGSVDAVAGDITLNTTGVITLSARGEIKPVGISYVANYVNRQAVGKAGNIYVTAGSLSLTDGAQLIASTLGQGDAGNVIINVGGNVSFDGTSSAAFSTVENGAVGKGGNVQISADSLSVTNGAGLLALSRGQGDAGNVIVNARGNVSFDGTSSDSRFSSSAFSTIEEGAVGKGGNVQISADSLSLTNSATLSARSFGQGDAGNVIINARGLVSFDGTDTYALSTVENGAVGKGGNVQISADSLSVTNGAQLLALSRGQGDAGNIYINAPNRVSISGTSSITGRSSALATSTLTIYSGGNITVNTTNLRVSDGAVLSA
ncbi:MAG: hypothetical protein SAK29_43010, partial [Scytonema sp. PMC 1069.18]|nr:hypothetical protein [Scytonema sp. PMC 1069.18]